MSEQKQFVREYMPRWTYERGLDGNLVSITDELGNVRKVVPFGQCDCRATAWGHLCAAARLAFAPILRRPACMSTASIPRSPSSTRKTRSVVCPGKPANEKLFSTMV